MNMAMMRGLPAYALWGVLILSMLLGAHAKGGSKGVSDEDLPPGTCTKSDLTSCPNGGACHKCKKNVCIKMPDCCIKTSDCPKCETCCADSVCIRDPFQPKCCAKDADCKGACKMCGPNDRCIPKPGCCASNAECPAGKICSANKCVKDPIDPKHCSSDAQCKATCSTCDLESNKCTGLSKCDSKLCQTCDGNGGCTGSCGPKVENDPEITGFDGKKRMFMGLGDFVILKEHDGIEVAATFSKAKPADYHAATNATKEYSWTQTVRVTSPEGEVLVCHLPNILQPDKQHVKVQATSSDGQVYKIQKVDQNNTQTVRFKSMYVKGVVKNGRLVGCQARSQRLNLYVVQMFGPDQAERDLTGKHDFAKPFTWLNMAFQVPEPLQTPVTGLIGETYPLNKATPSRRRLMSFEDEDESQADAPLVLAGITAADGEDLAELLL